MQLMVCILDDLSMRYKEKRPFIINEDTINDEEQEDDEEDCVDEAWNDAGIDQDGDVYIKQIDTTQDLSGFFLSGGTLGDKYGHIKQLAKKLNM